MLSGTFLRRLLALLELLRLGVTKVYQEGEFGSIWVINPEVRAQMDIRAIAEVTEEGGEEPEEAQEAPSSRYIPPVMRLPARDMALPAHAMTERLPSKRRRLPRLRRNKR
jgi:hypothetical protein